MLPSDRWIPAPSFYTWAGKDDGKIYPKDLVTDSITIHGPHQQQNKRVWPGLITFLRSTRPISPAKKYLGRRRCREAAMIVALAPLANVPCDRNKGKITYRAHPRETRLPSKCAKCVKSVQACNYTPGYFRSHSDKVKVILNFANSHELNRTLEAYPFHSASGEIRSHSQLFSYFWSLSDPARSNLHYANVNDLEARVSWAYEALSLGGYASKFDDEGVEYFTFEELKDFTNTPFDLSDLHEDDEGSDAEADAEVQVLKGKHRETEVDVAPVNKKTVNKKKHMAGKAGKVVPARKDVRSFTESEDESDAWPGGDWDEGVHVQGEGRVAGKRSGDAMVSGRNKRQQESTSAGRPSQQIPTPAAASLQAPPASHPTSHASSAPNQLVVTTSTSQRSITPTQAPMDLVSLTPAWMAIMAESVRSTIPDIAQQNRILGSLYGAWGGFVAKHGGGM